jgi:hypothetical protein
MLSNGLPLDFTVPVNVPWAFDESDSKKSSEAVRPDFSCRINMCFSEEMED